jgi:CubicO group peptidase (beta-lactamase class C family)
VTEDQRADRPGQTGSVASVGVPGSSASAATDRAGQLRVSTMPARRAEPPRWAPIGERMAWRGVPGVGVAVFKGGEIVAAESYGVKEAGAAEPVTSDTLFLAGSISKPVAALGALRLVEQGGLALDQDVNAYLRSWRVPANGTWQPRLTVRQLLSHTAGLTVHGFPGYARDEALPRLPQVLDGAPPANTPPVRVNLVPGTRFRYSGGGYCVLQQLMVDVVGQPFPELMRELVLEPAGMASSTFANPLPEARWGEAATGHRASAKPVHGRWHVYPEMAAAGLWTTPTDLARFAIGLQRAARGEPGGLLSAEMAGAMLTPTAPTTGPFGGPSMGLGLFLHGDGAASSFGHGGGDEGFVCRLHAYRDRGLGAVVMTNSDREHPLIDEVLRGLAVEHGWPGYLPETPAAAQVEPAAIDRHVGVYELRPGVQLRIAWSGDGLALHAPGQDAIGLRALSATAFAAEAVDADVTFDQDGLVLRQDGSDRPARRLLADRPSPPG